MSHGSLRQFGGYLRTHWVSPRRVRFWLLALVILYTFLGFFGVPWLVQYHAVNIAREDFGRALRIEAVHANPYTLTLCVDGLTLDDTDNRQLIEWNRLLLDLTWASIVNRAWTFQAVQLDQPVIHEERLNSGETRLSRLAATRSDQRSDEDEPAQLPALRIAELRVAGGILRFADNLPDAATDEPNRVSLALQDIELSVEALTLQEDTRFPARMNGTLAQGGKLAFDGTLQLLPSVALDGKASIDELALIQAEPYLRQLINVRIDTGKLNVSGQMNTDAQQPFAFQGSADIASLHIKDGSNDEPLIGWQSLRAEQLDLSFADRQLETGPLALDGLSGLVVIHEDRSTNFARLMASPPVDEGENGDSASKDENTGKEPASFNTTIEGIELSDGAFQFTDNSLALPFSTSIHALSGDVSTLSSTSTVPADVALEGEIAEYGLVRVEGSVHAWQPTRETNMQLTFRNLQIPEYSPYTVRFAGRKIADGTMDLDLGYTIRNKQLDGSNNLVFHNLRLGEKMDTSDAMDLPLDLAIALLEDNEGVIDLEFSITGDVGNPEFDFADIVRQALGEAVMTVVQSPANFLANLIGADSEDLGNIEYSPARAELLPPQRARIDTLREALNQRPALILELAGPFSRRFDGPALQREKAIETLRQHLNEANRDAADPSLTAESNQDIVETMFSNRYPEISLEAVQMRFVISQDDSTNEEATFDGLAYRSHLSERIIAAQTVTDTDLIGLANARAIAVRDALADSNPDTRITRDRVRILDPEEIESVEGEHIVMEVGITTDGSE